MLLATMKLYIVEVKPIRYEIPRRIFFFKTVDGGELVVLINETTFDVVFETLGGVRQTDSLSVAFAAAAAATPFIEETNPILNCMNLGTLLDPDEDLDEVDFQPSIREELDESQSKSKNRKTVKSSSIAAKETVLPLGFDTNKLPPSFLFMCLVAPISKLASQVNDDARAGSRTTIENYFNDSSFL